MRITRREKKFWEQHLSCVRHITLDPKGPGVVRLHMIPPRAEGKDEPFLLLLNGAKLIPLNLSWPTSWRPWSTSSRRGTTPRTVR